MIVVNAGCPYAVDCPESVTAAMFMHEPSPRPVSRVRPWFPLAISAYTAPAPDRRGPRSVKTSGAFRRVKTATERAQTFLPRLCAMIAATSRTTQYSSTIADTPRQLCTAKCKDSVRTDAHGRDGDVGRPEVLAEAEHDDHPQERDADDQQELQPNEEPTGPENLHDDARYEVSAEECNGEKEVGTYASSESMSTAIENPRETKSCAPSYARTAVKSPAMQITQIAMRFIIRA
jgi:hypothetical protein